MNNKPLLLEIVPVKSENEYEIMLDWVDCWLAINPSTDSQEGRKLQQALRYIQAYEDIHYPVPS